MLFVVIGVAGILVVSYLALDYVYTQFLHTKRSMFVLVGEAILSLFLGAFLASSLPDLPLYFRGAVGLALGLLVYSALSILTVEVWKRMSSASDEFHGNLGSLQEEMHALQGDYEDVVGEINELNAKKKALEREHDEELFRQRQLENEVHRWQGGGGMERIRSLRVEDWSRELGNLSAAQLDAMRRELQDRAAGEDPEREEALRVRVALAELELLRRSMREPNRELSEIKRALDEAESRKGTLALQLRELDREMRSWSHQGDDDSGDRIELR